MRGCLWGLAVFALATAAFGEVVLEFPVSNGETYHVRMETAGCGRTARLWFRDAKGRDIEATERALGYRVSARTAKIEYDGETVLEARAGGRHGTVAAQGVLSLEGEGTVRVKSARWFRGEAKSSGREHPSGIDPTVKGEADFAPNLLGNASFEETAKGRPSGWTYVGPGPQTLSRESYAGDYAVRLTPENEGGRWQSDPFEVAPDGRLEVLFAIRYSVHAVPRARRNPVNVEFLDAAGRVVQHPFRWQLDMRYFTSDRISEWAMMSVPPYVVPKGAVKARVFIEHKDTEPTWSGVHTIGWGDIFVDNISVWQRSDAVDVPFETSALRGATQLYGTKKPPRQPVGRRRNGSVWTIQPVTEDFSFFFASEGAAPKVDLTFGNFLSCERRLVLKGDLKGPDGRPVRQVACEVRLSPYEMKTCGIPVGAPGAYGGYSLAFELLEKGARVGFGNAYFIWLDHRTSVSRAERGSVDYPFCMHPLQPFAFEFKSTPETRHRQSTEARMLGLIGVGGIRQQFHWEDIDNDPVRCAARAREIVERWRREQKPLLDRYGMRSWISFMEQANGKLPKTEAEAVGWKAFWKALAGAVSNDVECVLFGNEGVGGYAAGYGPDDDLWKQTAFRGTLRQWVDDYRWMREGIKAANAGLDVGFAFAADVEGSFTREFYSRFPGLKSELWAMNGYVRPCEMIRTCRSAMGEENARGRYIILPEFGVPSPPGEGISEKSRAIAERMAMDILDTKANAPAVRRIAWFIQASTDDDPMGVFSLTYQPRAAAAGYLVMTDTLGAGRVAKTVRLPDGGRFHVWERTDGRRIGLGVSPSRMKVVASVSNGRLDAMDAFGNRSPVEVKSGTAVIRLGPKPTYFVGGEGLDVPERFKVTCSGPTDVADGSVAIDVAMDNLSDGPIDLEVSSVFAPALVVEGDRRTITLDARARQVVPMRVRFVGTDGNRKLSFAVTAKDRYGFCVEASLPLRFKSRTAENLLGNPGFDEADADGRLAAWTEEVRFAEGRPRPAIRIRQRTDAGYEGRNCASFVIPAPGTSGAVLSLSQRIPITPGRRYYWSLRRRGLKGSYSWSHAAIRVLDAAGNTIATPAFDPASEEDGWTLDEGGFVAPDNAAYIVFMPLITNGGRGEVLYDRCELLDVTDIRPAADFALSLRRTPNGDPIVVASSNAISRMKRDGVTAYAFAAGSPVTSVVTRVTRDASGLRRYRIDVAVADGWHLETTGYPLIDVPYPLSGDGSDDRCVVGATVGGVWRPKEIEVGRSIVYPYPGSLAAQFCATWDNDTGFYFAAEDAVGYEKGVGIRRLRAGNRFVHERRGWDTGVVTGAYDVVAKIVRRTDEPLVWEDFADIYRVWLMKQPWMRKTYLERTDVPAWMKRAPAMTRYSRQWLAKPEQIGESLAWWKRTFGDNDVIAAVWGWEKVGTWWGPDYFPAFPNDETLKSETAMMRRAGFHPFAWPSCYNWSECIGRRADGSYRHDYRETYMKEASDIRCVTRAGEFHRNPAPWMDNGANAMICGGHPKARAWLRELCRGLAERGFDMIQFDQSPGGRLNDCWATTHGHRPGMGTWNFAAFMESYREMQAGLKSVVPDGCICVEQPHEQFTGCSHLQDYRDVEDWTDSCVGVFNYLHHGYLPVFQSNPYRDNLFALAHMAVEGQVPFYKLLDEDLRERRLALKNGGFETRSDDARMAALCWEVGGRMWLSWSPTPEKPIWDFEGAACWQGEPDWEDRHGGAVSYRMNAETKPEQCGQTVRDLAPGEYLLSAWVKTERLDGTGALLWGDTAGEKGRVAFPPAGTGWRKISAKVRADGKLRVILYAGVGVVAKVDDVELTHLDGTPVYERGESLYLRAMRAWIRLYQGEGRDFLAYGFREKPPRLDCATFTMAGRTRPAVLCAAYRSADGRHALAVANATDSSQTFSCTWRGQSLSRMLQPAEFVQIVDAR